MAEDVPQPASCTVVSPAAVTISEMSFTPAWRSSRELLEGINLEKRPFARSATMPVNTPSTLSNLPPVGSGVSALTPAIWKARLLYQLVWPPRWVTRTG